MRPGTCVLIVQDGPYIARLLRLQLKHRNLKTRCEPDGPSGVEAATEFDFELIILDVLLPGMDGVGVLKALRRRVIGYRSSCSPSAIRRRSIAWTWAPTTISPSRSAWRAILSLRITILDQSGLHNLL